MQREILGSSGRCKKSGTGDDTTARHLVGSASSVWFSTDVEGWMAGREEVVNDALTLPTSADLMRKDAIIK